jgi:hypothetical protein
MPAACQRDGTPQRGPATATGVAAAWAWLPGGPALPWRQTPAAWPQFGGLAYGVAQVDYMHEAVRGISYTPTFAVFRRGKKVRSQGQCVCVCGGGGHTHHKHTLRRNHTQV